MAAAYSMDLRERVIAGCRDGALVERVSGAVPCESGLGGCAETAVSRNTVHCAVETDEVPSPRAGGARGTRSRSCWPRSRMRPSPSCGWRCPPRRGWPRCGARFGNSISPSKKTVHADEQRRADVAAARRHWRDWQPARDAAQYIFLDECGVTTDLLRRYGRSPRGTRLSDHTPCNHWQTHTVVAALRAGESSAPPRCLTARLITTAFWPMSSKCSCPRSRVGAIVVLDNLVIHKQPAVRAGRIERGRRPAAIPLAALHARRNFNPFQWRNGLRFAKLKAVLSASARPTHV